MRLAPLILILLLPWTIAAQHGAGEMPHGHQNPSAAQDSTSSEMAPEAPTPSIDREQVRRDAAELSFLSQGIPGSADQVLSGTVPKDLNDRLKKIEKLAKRLRSEMRLQ